MKYYVMLLKWMHAMFYWGGLGNSIEIQFTKGKRILISFVWKNKKIVLMPSVDKVDQNLVAYSKQIKEFSTGSHCQRIFRDCWHLLAKIEGLLKEF